MLRSLHAVAAALLFPAALAAQHAHAGHTPPGPHGTPAPGLQEQLQRVRENTARFRDFEVARREGYRLFGSERPFAGEHWYHPGLTHAALDLARPSTLQYATIGGRKVLVGVAYTLYRRTGDPIPDGFAGTADEWHVHDVARLSRALTADRPLLRSVVERRIRGGRMGAGEGRTELTMVHAWVWLDNPDGVFAGEHRVLPYLRAGLPAAWAASGSRDAAQGVALIPRDGCEDDLRGTAGLARADHGQRRSIRSACDQAAAEVRAVLQRTREPGAVNAAAARAWSGYQQRVARILRPGQRDRLRAVAEAAMEGHGAH